ncbi:MAG TPA: hypothetical protein VNL94_08825 [Candidatus Binatia bacterium]|nr:hypothetical protein [Candidatus Binatia bacterium]
MAGARARPIDRVAGPGRSRTRDRAAPGEQPPRSLDPGRDDTERNAAAGGWDGANEQIETDDEAEQLRRAREDDAGKTPLV